MVWIGLALLGVLEEMESRKTGLVFQSQMRLFTGNIRATFGRKIVMRRNVIVLVSLVNHELKKIS